jgi:hypothetical protein
MAVTNVHFRTRCSLWSVAATLAMAASADAANRLCTVPGALTQIPHLGLCVPALPSNVLQYERLGMSSHYKVFEDLFTDY